MLLNKPSYIPHLTHCFVYLGSIVNLTNTLDDEISLQTKKANNAFRKLNGCLWSQCGISIEIKRGDLQYICFVFIIVCMWDQDDLHMKRQAWFHQQYLLYIGYLVAIDIDILKHNYFTSIESLILQHWLHWSDHVVRMKDNRIPKHFLHSELAEEKNSTQTKIDINIAPKTHWKRPTSCKMTC